MITASFAKPVGLFDNWFNRLTAYVTGGEFCHSEFIFSFSIEQMEKFLKLINEENSPSWKKKIKRYEEDGFIHMDFFIVWGDTVSIRLLKKTHNNPYYKFPNEREFSLINIKNTTEEEELQLAKFLHDQVKKEYDYYAALTYYIPGRDRAASYNKYFCSQLMVASLQQINRLKSINPSSVTPNKLHALLLIQ